MSARAKKQSGAHRGSGRAERRGTVLLMVVGVLALMSIVAVVYVTIGQADRRGAAALVREQRLDDQSRAVADYIAGIIADDVVSVQSVIDPSGVELIMREAFDAPTMDTSMRSQNPDATLGQIRFDPVGQGTDPFLADIEPTWLRFNRADSPRDTGGERHYLDNLDWGQITNISPDGRFVNLGNIRGNFAAEPGFDDDADGRPRTSWGLTLFIRGAGGMVQRVGTPANPVTNIRLDSNTNQANPRIPFHWSTRQVNAFRPIRDVDRRAGAPGVGTLTAPFVTVGTPEWLPNQWADADGDGMADSRWTELVDVTDEDVPRPVLRGDGSLRIFIATRIIDLSGLVNVNTAGDLFAPLPGNGTGDDLYPLGLTPGDVDLRSLLTLRTHHDMLGDDQTYAMYQQPTVTPVLPSDYSSAFGAEFDADTAKNAAFAGYSALRRAMREGQLSQGPVDVSAGGELFGRAAKYAAYQRLASGSEGARPDGAGAYEVAFRFGVADQAELLSYFGTNDPNVTSALEATLDGRWDNGTVGSPESRLGPLRSNRPLSVERDGVGDFFPTPQTAPHVINDGMPDDEALLKAMTDVRSKLTTVSGSRPIISTPVSGPGAPITASEVAGDVYALLEANDVPGIFTAYAQALLPWSGVTFPPEGTSTVQLPWVIEGADFTSAKSDRARTLSYGHRGPELPLWMAAFMAVNLRDAYDTDDNPTSYTLLVDTAYRTSGSGWNTNRFAVPTFAESLTSTPSGATSSPFWPNTEGRILDLAQQTGDANRLARTDQQQPPLNDPQVSRLLAAPAVNIFGVEAQPFLTQVAMFACFTDTPQAAGGDDDAEAWVDRNGDMVRDDDELTKVSINGDVSDGNADFLFQLIAFQVHNPFEFSVSLNGGTSPFVLQFGSSRFEFQSGVTIGAKATKVFYCITPGRTTVNSRLTTRWTGTLPAINIDSWLSYQLDIDPSEIAQNELTRYDVDSAIGSPVVGDTAALDMLDSDDEANRVALLWRRETVGSEPRLILVDRMRDPELTGTPSLDRSFDLPDIDGTLALGSDPDDVEGTDTSTDGGTDDTGFSLLTFGSFRRPDDPGASSGGIPLGAIPAFCLERRAFGTTTASRPLNVGPDDDSSLRDAFTNLGSSATMDRSDFVGSLGAPTPGKTTLSNLLTPQTTAEVALASIKQNPRSRTGQRIDANIAGVAFEDRYIEAFLPNNRFRLPSPADVRTMRPTDLLLPWALGSWQLPGVSGLEEWRSERRASLTLADPPLEWATLSEMLAMALDYEAPSLPSQKDLFFDDTQTTQWRAGDQAYDRACLRIDRFVPFIDMNNDRIFGYKPPPAPAQTPEAIAPPGIPLATTVVDRLRVREAGSIARSVPGLININTAPLDSLRALPGLSPPNPALDVGTAQWFWAGVQDSSSDIATTMKAYRDNVGLWPRDVSGTGVNSLQVNFRPDNNPSPAGANGFGRRWKTGIQGLRQPYTQGTPALDAKFDRSANGFRSIGEAMIVRDRSIGAPTPPATSAPGAYPYSIDRLAYDRENVGGTVADPVYIADSTRYDSGSGPRPNQIIDDYQEQFAISGALMNSISVRSDVFAAWFILRGYTVNDVEGLEIQEPMVPSVERRFLMIIDRSNVTQRGQKPRVLLFKELPL